MYMHQRLVYKDFDSQYYSQKRVFFSSTSNFTFSVIPSSHLPFISKGQMREEQGTFINLTRAKLEFWQLPFNISPGGCIIQADLGLLLVKENALCPILVKTESSVFKIHWVMPVILPPCPDPYPGNDWEGMSPWTPVFSNQTALLKHMDREGMRERGGFCQSTVEYRLFQGPQWGEQWNC